MKVVVGVFGVVVDGCEWLKGCVVVLVDDIYISGVMVEVCICMLLGVGVWLVIILCWVWVLLEEVGD